MKKQIYFGIDLGGTTIKIGPVTTNGEIIEERIINTNVELGPVNAIERVAQTIDLLTKAHEDYEIVAAGIGVPGILDIKAGKIVEASNFPGWENFEITKELSRRINIPVFLENDANLAALGEQWLGAGAGSKDMFMVTLGSGVGGALITNGKLFSLNEVSGEFGHMIINFEGPKCSCGRNGCVEAYFSKHGLKRITKEKLQYNPVSVLKSYDEDKLTPQIIANAAMQGDKLAIDIFKDASKAMGIAISNIINLLGVHKIVIGGGIANAWQIFYEPMMEVINHVVFKANVPKVKLVKAVLGEKAGFIGAARCAMLGKQ
jgi:glucokinase